MDKVTHQYCFQRKRHVVRVPNRADIARVADRASTLGLVHEGGDIFLVKKGRDSHTVIENVIAIVEGK